MTTPTPSNPATEGGEPTLTEGEIHDLMALYDKGWVDITAVGWQAIRAAQPQAAEVTKFPFMIGDVVIKVNSLISDQIPDGSKGVVQDWGSEYVAVLFDGRGHDVLVEYGKLAPRQPVLAPDDFVPNKKFTDMTPEELAKWHADEYKMWMGETVEESFAKDNGQPVLATTAGEAIDDSWKFRKMGAGVSSTDYRETLSREGLLDYLKERESTMEDVYHQLRAQATELHADNERLSAQLATLTAPLSATVGNGYGIPEVSVADLIKGYREEIRFLSDGRSHTDNILCDVIERQAAEITALTRQQQAAGGLVEALKPFAETWDNYLTEDRFQHGIDFLDFYGNESDEETVRDMHRESHRILAAYEALSAGGQPDTGANGEATSHETI